MRYQDLVESVRDRVGLDNAGQARHAVSAVLATLAHCLPPQARHRVAEALPGSLDPAVEVPGQQETRDGTGLLIEIGQRLDVPVERARYLGLAVLAELRSGAPDLVDYLHEQLSTDVLEVLSPAGDPPSRAASRRPEVPDELTDVEVEQALAGLPDWAGDRNGIARTVLLPADRLDPLINRVQREARDFNDHAHVQRDDGSVTFTLHTGRRAVVTGPDIELAQRIDRVVAEVGSGGRPGG